MLCHKTTESRTTEFQWGHTLNHETNKMDGWLVFYGILSTQAAVISFLKQNKNNILNML